MSEEAFNQAHAALDRMRRAAKRGTGCHLTADMIYELSLTFLAQTWEQQRPCEGEEKDHE